MLESNQSRWRRSFFKPAALFVFVCCAIWLTATLFFSKSQRHSRGLSLLSTDMSPARWLSQIIHGDNPSSNQKPISNGHLTPALKSQNAFRIINESVPWMHYYASSPKILENYFFHGYHHGLDKYYKRFTHSRLAILPFLSDTNEQLRKCVNQLALHQNMAVSHHTSMSERWQWESSNEGVAKFKEKYKLFYGQASLGTCLQNFLGPTAPDILGDSHRFPVGSNPRYGERFAQKRKSDRYFNDLDFLTDVNERRTDPVHNKDSSNCGQILLLQHPVSKSVEEYFGTFPKKAHCSDSDGNDGGDDYDNVDENSINDDDNIIKWIKNRGNVVFQHLIFHPDMCSHNFFLKVSMRNESHNMQKNNKTISNNYEDLKTNFSNPSEDNVVNERNIITENEKRNNHYFENPCNRNLKLFLEGLDTDTENALVNHIIDKLPVWFSMVGLHEDLHKSLHMLDLVHRFPLNTCLQKESEGKGLHSVSSNANSNRKCSGKQCENNNNSKNNEIINSFPKEEHKSKTIEKATENQSFKPITTKTLNLEAEVNPTFSGVFKDLIDKSRLSDETSLRDNDTEQTIRKDTGNTRVHGQKDELESILSMRESQPSFVDKDFSQVEYGNGILKSETQYNNYNGPRLKVCNDVSDFQQIFHRLSQNKEVQRALGLDIKIYNAVKRLYQHQKQIVFNSLKA